jgi:formamidopyrimidine-DNA glycosylase
MSSDSRSTSSPCAHRRNERNDYATCQTDGTLLADRVLSRLLKDDWPKTLDELEERKRG